MGAWLSVSLRRNAIEVADRGGGRRCQLVGVVRPRELEHDGEPGDGHATCDEVLVVEQACRVVGGSECGASWRLRSSNGDWAAIGAVTEQVVEELLEIVDEQVLVGEEALGCELVLATELGMVAWNRVRWREVAECPSRSRSRR